MEDNFPIAIGFARQLREVFGDKVRLLGAEENGRTVGRKVKLDGDWGNVIVFPDYNQKTTKKGRK